MMMEIKVRSGLSPKGLRETSRFVRMFYVMAAAPIALLAEAVLKNSAAASAASGVIMLSIMAAIIVYAWAMFKSFHACIFNSEAQASAWKFVVSKMALAVSWLIALALTVSLILFMHMTILEKMPEIVMKADFAQWMMDSVSDSFGKGVFQLFSAASLLFQAIVLITITYAAAVVSHLKTFDRYKTLAGIFVFVLLYFFENDLAGALKRIFIHAFGGIEALLSNHLKSAMGVLTGIEFAAYLIIAAINVTITCCFLKKMKEDKKEWKK